MTVKQAGTQIDRPYIKSQNPIEVIPGFFELEANYNYGAFSGWFSRHTGALTIISGAAVLVIVAYLMYSLRKPTPPGCWFIVALALICGGTLGNLYDRYFLNAVRDWIKWFFVWNEKEHVWPNFNIADSGICVGVSLIIFLEVLNGIKERKNKRASSASD
jgi:signal peptidase II